jgi:hypothetical protein
MNNLQSDHKFMKLMTQILIFIIRKSKIKNRKNYHLFKPIKCSKIHTKS